MSGTLRIQHWLESCKRLLALLIWAAWFNCAAASNKDASSPIDISADSVEIDEGHNTSTYNGKVEAQQGSMHLWADHVAVQHQPSRQPARIIADGFPTRYQQTEQDGQEIKAAAKRMDYDVLKQEILLFGDAHLTRSKDSFSSDRIIYDRNRGIIRAGTSAQGHQRVHISIIPDSAPKPESKSVSRAGTSTKTHTKAYKRR